MTTESRPWMLAKLLAAREDAVRRLKLATSRGAWREAAAQALLAAEAEDEIAGAQADAASTGGDSRRAVLP
jgi:hypothetical protein